MLTIKPVSKAQDALKYYTDADNYYLSDKETLLEMSRWLGKGAQKLALNGAVMPEQFLPLLEGRLPNGEMLGIVKDGVREHRTGTDITLSAPKSVSIMALVAEDKRLIEAHHQAVNAVKDKLEEIAAEARLTVDGETVFEKTNNLVIAAFTHTTTRDLDPGLHDHLVNLNMTERSDGQWRALSSRAKNDLKNINHGFREIIYDNQHYLGLIYSSVLAKETTAIGYDIQVKDKYGNFEIVGVSDELIKDFSKRRQDIIAQLEKEGHSSAKAAEMANLLTREVKKSIDSKELRAHWQREAKEHNTDLANLIAKSKENSTKPANAVETLLPSISGNEKEAVADALSHLSQFNAQIKHSDLVRQAFIFSAGTYSHEAIEQEITSLQKDNKLQGCAFDYYTTESLQKKEQLFVEKLLLSQKKSYSIACDNSSIAAKTLQNPDNVQIIEVSGLSNQKHLINDMISQSESKGLNAFVLHVGRNQANQLANIVSRDSSSLWKWLKNQFKHDIVHTVAGFKYQYGLHLDNPFRNKSKQEYVIVHDAQKLSYQDISDLSELTQRNQSKLILLHNRQSTDGFGAGSPLKALKDAGFNTLEAKSAPNNVEVEITPSLDIRRDLVKHYANLSPSERQNATIVALSKKEQEDINQQIRKILIDEGHVSRQSKTVNVLSSTSLSDSQKKYGKFYHPEDRISFSPFTKEQTNYRVLNCKNNQLTVKNETGEISTIDLQGKLDYLVTKNKTIEIGIGERLHNEQALYINRERIEKGSEFEVKAINSDGVLVNYGDKELFLDNLALADSVLTYDYSRRLSTLRSDKKELLMATEPYKLNKQIYGELSENAASIKLFTQDKIKAQEKLDKSHIKWTVKDIATRQPELVYRQIEFADKAIENDIKFLAEDLSRQIETLDTKEVSERALAYAVAVCAESEAAFSHAELMSNALKCGIGKIDHKDVESLLAERIKQADLKHLGTYWVTKESLAIEKEIINTSAANQNTVSPIEGNKNKLLNLPDNLTQGQKDAITLAVTTSDRFVSVQGLAGVGKTTMLNLVKNIANENGYNIVGLGPTHRSVQELNANGIEAHTIDSFLNNEHGVNEKSLLIVDEVSMVGNSQYAKIQKKTLEANARSVLAGDITQLQSLPSGIPHELTITSKSQKTAYMEEIVRQNANPLLKKAAEHASKRQITKSFEYLDKIKPDDYVKRQDLSFEKQNGSVIEVNCIDKETKNLDLTPIYTAVSNDYLSRTREHQDRTVVIVHAHKDRKIIDTMIRSGLQEQGRVENKEHKVGRLFSKSIKLADLLDATNFKENDVLRFDRTYSVARKGDYFTVTKVVPEQNLLKCKSEDGHEFSINPNKVAEKSLMSVYSYEEFDLAKNDVIRLRRTDKVRGHIANEEYKVNEINQEGIATLIDKNGNKMPLNLNEKKDMHWDYGYTHTAFAIQGGTESFVIALELNARVGATNHRAHEIDITRAKYQATVYTENKKGLIERLDDRKKQLKTDKKSALKEYKKSEFYNNKVAGLQEKNKLKKTEFKTENSLVNDVQYIQDENIKVDEILPILTNQMEELSTHLLGEPNRAMSTRMNLRYGTNGSLSIDLNKGLWFNFETSEGGNALQLISNEMGFSFKESLEYAKDFTKYTPGLKPVIKENKDSSKVKKPDEGKRNYARKLFNKAKDIKGTLSEKYLIEHRKVTNFKNVELKHLDSIKTYHDKKEVYTPALIVIGRDKNGEFKYIQAIKLDPRTGGKDLKSNVDKPIYGKPDGNGIHLNKLGKSDTTYLTEGVETGLSVLKSKKDSDVVAVLSKSNFSNILLDRVKDNVVICLDNDGKNTFQKVIKNAIERFENAGKKVQLVVPEKTGYDFNDVLIKDGKTELDKQLGKLITPKEYYKQEQMARDSNLKNEHIKVDKLINNSAQERLINKIINDEISVSRSRIQHHNKEQYITNKAIEKMVKSEDFNQKSKGIDREMEL